MDSAQKRMSAMNPACPWRGPMVDATETGTTQGNRQAAVFMYSGIAASAVVVGLQRGYLLLLNVGRCLPLIGFLR